MIIPKQLSPREKKILALTVAMLLVVGGYYGVWVPMQAKFQTLGEQIFSMQLKLRKSKTFLRQQDDIREEAKKYQNLELMDAGKDEEEIARLLNLIEQTARKNSVSLSDVKPQAVQSDKVAKRYVVELHAEASLEGVLRFFYELQTSAELLKVEQVEIAPKEENAAILRCFLIVTRVVVK